MIDGRLQPDRGHPESQCGAVAANVADAARAEDGTPRAAAPVVGSSTERRAVGGQQGNRNAQRHGLRSAKLPKDSKYIEYTLNALRLALEAAVLDSHGAVTVTHAALVQSAVRHERRAALAERWGRVKPDLTLSEKLSIEREIGNATDARDRCIERLKLDESDRGNIIDTLYSRSVAQNSSKAASTPVDDSWATPDAVRRADAIPGGEETR